MLYNAKKQEEGVVQDDNDPDHRTTGCQQDILLSPALILVFLSLVVLIHLKLTKRNRCLHLLFVNVQMAWIKKVP